MTIEQRIISLLEKYPDGIDDDEIARILDLKSRQQANARCRKLERDGFVLRKKVDDKIKNFWLGNKEKPTQNKDIKNNDQAKHRYWFWEGNVQSMTIKYLVSQGFLIRSAADTASHQTGIDIIAEKNGKTLWVSVKGYPKGTEKTNPAVQAAHWFKQAIFDVIEYRERDRSVELAVALPNYPRYHNMAKKISWIRPVANFQYFWVEENGDVYVE